MNDWLLKNSCRVRNGVEAFVKGEEAPTAIEYAIMASLIAAVIVTSVSTLGGNLNTIFVDMSAAFPTGN